MSGGRMDEREVETADPRTEALASDWLSTRRSVRRRGLSTSAFLSQQPEAKSRKSMVLGLACEEYVRRLEQGEAVDREEFCRQFPDYQQSVARLLSVYGFLKQHDLLPDAIDVWPEPGETIAGYELLDGLGLGAFARVYLASEPAVANRRVAVKASAEGAAEAEILGKLSHPNIVPVYSVRQDEEQRWTLICMPYRGQATLEDVIGALFPSRASRPQHGRDLLAAVERINRDVEPTEPTTPDPALYRYSYVEAVAHLLAQLADALAYSHTKGVCHRDLKPSNVLIAPDGRPMLLDFNLSQDRAVAQRRLGGTLPYMAPEQLEATVLEPTAASAPIDPRSDLFSLGIVAYELLTGEWPYGAILPDLAPDEFATELFERQRGGPPPLKRLNPDVDPQLSDLIQRCVSFDADARPQTAMQLAAELRRNLSLRRRAVRKLRKHSALTAFAAGALLAAAGSTSYYFATREPSGVRELRAARASLDGGDLTTAVRRLDNAARFGVPAPTRGALADAYYEVGKQAYEHKDYDAARVHLTRAIDMGVKKWQAWFYRGATCWRLEQWDEAVKDYVKAQQAGGGPEADACVGEYAKHLGGHPNARKNYLKAIEKGMKNAAVFNNLGMATLYSPVAGGAHWDEAEKYFETAVELNPQAVEPRLNLAFVKISRVLRNKGAADEETLEAARALAERSKQHPKAMALAAAIFAREAPMDSPNWLVAGGYLWQAFAAGLTLDDIKHMPELKLLAAEIQRRHGFDELLRNQPKNVPVRSRYFEMLDELGY